VSLLQGQSEQEIIRTLAHEMIHQWQYDVLKRRPNHGPDFHRMKDILNREGYGVTVRHGLEQAVLSFSKYMWRCLNCGVAYHRQRRTIRPAVHRCGTCRGLLREISSIPARTEGGTTHAGVPTTRRIRERAGAVRQLKLPY
jgi:predicted SprT family Zn-dependent metalloprotease